MNAFLVIRSKKEWMTISWMGCVLVHSNFIDIHCIAFPPGTKLDFLGPKQYTHLVWSRSDEQFWKDINKTEIDRFLTLNIACNRAGRYGQNHRYGFITVIIKEALLLVSWYLHCCPCLIMIILHCEQNIWVEIGRRKASNAGS